MASRKQQKEEARQRRLAEERARQEREQRARRMQMGLGGLLAAIAVAVIAVVVVSSSGSSKLSGTGSPTKVADTSGVKLPALKISDLNAAVKAAGCTTLDTPDSIARTDANRTHVQPGTKVPYATNPPSFGPHYPVPASDGEYAPSKTPAAAYVVHALEHGRIEYQYSPSLPAADVKQLRALFNEGVGQWAPKQMLLLFQNQTKMPYAVAATAWGHVLGCKTFSPRVFDAFRDFRLTYTNQGPEQLGTGPE
jgi:Protein of unknown function (DUF3105)